MWKINSHLISFLQGLYVATLVLWLLLQMFALPFLFEQEQTSVFQALQNGTIFVRQNLVFVAVLGLLLAISLVLGTLAFMLTFVFGAALIAFAGNHAVLESLENS